MWQRSINSTPSTAAPSSSSAVPRASIVAAKISLSSPTPHTAPVQSPGAGVVRSYASVAAAHQRPMAGVPPSVRGASVSGGTNPHPAPVMGVTSTPSRPPAQTPGFSSPPLLQRGPAPVYNYGGNQPPSYGQARHYAPPYGPAVAGAPGSTYRTSPSGMSVPSQFHPGGIVAQPV